MGWLAARVVRLGRCPWCGLNRLCRCPWDDLDARGMHACLKVTIVVSDVVGAVVVSRANGAGKPLGTGLSV